MAERQHDDLEWIKPAGMTYDRALEIAVAASIKAAPTKRDADLDTVFRLHTAGRTDPEIAIALVATRSYAVQLRQALGLQAHPAPRGPRITEEKLALLEQVRDLHAQGFTDGEVARLMARPYEWARDRRLRLGLPLNARKAASAA